ncbi:MAG: helix-turn-helix transcriptional regulator [Deltaproteobacteria bacterium]|nr:helix-turn-helix transcriptional regulator [Deltaproteobacteria bacterium]
MTPEEIRALRKQLRCTMQELAAALEVEPRVVVAWEDAEMFPTRQYVEKMMALAEKGPGAVPRRGRRSRTDATTPMQALADPELWRLFRKLVAHPELRRQATALADGFDEPE